MLFKNTDVINRSEWNERFDKDFKKHETPDLTQGNITASVILFSLPLIISSILQILYHSVDTFLSGTLWGRTIWPACQ